MHRYCVEECKARTPDGDINGMTHLESGSIEYNRRPLYIRFKEIMSIGRVNRWWLACGPLSGADFFGREFLARSVLVRIERVLSRPLHITPL